MESAKYFEKIGVIQFNLGTGGSMKDFNQFWANCSLSAFYNLANTNKDNFPTPEGQIVKSQLQTYWHLLKLGDVFGCAPKQYNPSASIGDPSSLYYLWINRVLPTYFSTSGNTPIVVQNMASLRAPVYAGKVNRNDVFAVYPFDDDFVYFKAMNGIVLLDLLAVINKTKSGMEAKPQQCGHVGDTGVGYYISDIAIEPATLYDVIETPYDSTNFIKALGSIYPGVPFSSQLYPGKGGPLRGTQLFEQFIKNNWPCP
jgi:hypothetical protein